MEKSETMKNNIDKGFEVAKLAILIKDNLPGFNGKVHLYRMEPIYQGSKYVVISATNAMFSGPETYIFSSDKDGNVTSWIELEGSERGFIDIDRVIKNIGYTKSK